MFILDIHDHYENNDSNTQYSTLNDACETIPDSLVTKSQALLRNDVFYSNLESESVNSISLTRKFYFLCYLNI